MTINMDTKKKNTDNAPASPVCYAQSNELRDGFKDEGKERHPSSDNKKSVHSGKTNQEKC